MDSPRWRGAKCPNCGTRVGIDERGPWRQRMADCARDLEAEVAELRTVLADAECWLNDALSDERDTPEETVDCFRGWIVTTWQHIYATLAAAEEGVPSEQ